MRHIIPAITALGLLAAPPAMAQVDMAAAQKWSSAKIVKYRVEGLHQARAAVVHGDYEGKAEVVDRLTLEFSWDVKKRAVIGPVTIADAKTVLRNMKSDGTNCPPPQLKGDYEHFQSVSHSVSRDQIQISGTRTYPAASVSNYPASCSMRSIPGATEKVHVFLAGTAPEVLAMPNMAGSPIAIAPDRKSFTIKGAENWVWTFTPTVAQ